MQPAGVSQFAAGTKAGPSAPVGATRSAVGSSGTSSGGILGSGLGSGSFKLQLLDPAEALLGPMKHYTLFEMESTKVELGGFVR